MQPILTTWRFRAREGRLLSSDPVLVSPSLQVPLFLSLTTLTRALTLPVPQVVIVPGYGLAVAGAQYAIAETVKTLTKHGIKACKLCTGGNHLRVWTWSREICFVSFGVFGVQKEEEQRDINMCASTELKYDHHSLKSTCGCRPTQARTLPLSAGRVCPLVLSRSRP